jgi:hypothetical protein
LLCAIWLFGTAREKGKNSPNLPFFLPSLFGILKNLLTFAAEQQNERHAKEKHPLAARLPQGRLVAPASDSPGCGVL